MELDHVGIVVRDLDAAIEHYISAYGLRLKWTEPPTEVDPVAIGLPDEPVVRLRGAMLAPRGGGTGLELHQYLTPQTGPATGPRRICDEGIGHVAFRPDDLYGSVERLTRCHIAWNTAPRTIRGGPLHGRQWAYGTDPYGGVVIEVCTPPALLHA